MLAQISEEVGELARNLNTQYGGRVKKSTDNIKGVKEEICDIMFGLICLANSHNIDLYLAWRDTISRRCNRDKDRYERK
jgi:NTP pyrophosphatase (non-canonical NTP hydrolase)